MTNIYVGPRQVRCVLERSYTSSYLVQTGASVGPRWSFAPANAVVSSVRLLDKDNCDLLSHNQLEVEISMKPRPRFLSVA